MIVQVAKEHLGYLSKNPPTMIKPNSTSLSDPTYLHSLLQKVLSLLTNIPYTDLTGIKLDLTMMLTPQREIKLFTTLGKKMAAAGTLNKLLFFCC